VVYLASKPDPDDVLIPLFTIRGDYYREGVDYKVLDTPPVQVVERK
jgi:hypothetical protein